MSLFAKREHWLNFSAIKKSSFLKSMLLLNFLIRWSWNILNLFNILMMLNKCIIWWFWFDVTLIRISSKLFKFLNNLESTAQFKVWSSDCYFGFTVYQVSTQKILLANFLSLFLSSKFCCSFFAAQFYGACSMPLDLCRTVQTSKSKPIFFF